jgi:RNA polymerase sigma factor (sigma-70 family)
MEDLPREWWEETYATISRALRQVPRETVEDIAHDYALHVLTRGRLEAPPSQSYARRFARWRLLDVVRRQRRSTVLTDVPSATANEAIRAAVSDVFTAAARLPKSQLEVFNLWLDGKSEEEIARRLGKPSATIRSNLRHARLRLAEEAEMRIT